MSMFLSRLIFMSWILLQNAFKCSEVPEMKFALYDGLREPTSFLYENGFIEVRCNAPSIKPNAEIMLKATPKNSEAIVVEQGNGSLSFNISLREFDYEKLFCYSNQEISPKLILTDRLCDPMLLIPPITTCGDKEVCLKTADSISMCGKMSEISCDISNQHQFKEKYVCIQKLDPSHQQGLCQATKTNTNNTQFSGVALSDITCENYENLKLNGKVVEEESIWFISNTNTEYTAQFTRITRKFIEGRCQLRIEGESFFLANGTSKNITEVESKTTLILPKTTLILPLDLSMTKRLSLPMKAKLICYVKTLVGPKTTSAYAFLFDEKKFFPAIKTTLIDASTGFYSLNCEAKMVDGILFSVSWDREPNTYFAKTSEDKIIANKFDDSAQKHTCYVAAFAYNYPYKGKLVKLDLPSGSVNNSVEIEKGGAPGKCLYDTEHKTPGFCDGNAGSGTVKLDKDMMHHAAGKSAKETSVDLSHDSHFQKWEQV